MASGPDDHSVLLRTDIHYAAFWSLWRVESADHERELGDAFPHRTKGEIREALEIGRSLLDAVSRVKDSEGDRRRSFEDVANEVKKMVPKASRRACETAADKVFFVNR